MKHTQGIFFSGSMEVKVTGKFPEFFFNRCVEDGIPVWNLRKIDEHTCTAYVRLQDLSYLRRIRRSSGYKLSFVSRKGLPFYIMRFLNRKPLILGFVASIFLIFFLSNMVWDVKVEGVHPELEHKIVEKLNHYGVKKGAWKFSLDSPSKIQQQLMHDIPDLLWIGVSERGTTYILQGVERTVVEEQEKAGPRNIIARKKGIIVDMFVSEGKPNVKLHQFVEKGDVLVSGEIGQEDNLKYVRADGEVIAETWYQSQVSIPLKVQYSVLTDQRKKKYAISFGDFLVPIWGFGDPDYKQVHIDKDVIPVNFFKWKLPIYFVRKTLSEQEEIIKNRTLDEAKQAGIAQARKELMKQLPLNSKIKQEKILHQENENGKVKLILYFKVEENIAQYQPLTQGD